MSADRVEDHFAELRGHLAGKDPRRLDHRARGQALLVLTDERGQPHRLTIHVKAKTVDVEARGAVPADGESFAMIRGSSQDWLQFYRNATPETLAALSLYGDMELISAVGELVTQTRTLWDLRSGGAS